jgi:hypothetical protein
MLKTFLAARATTIFVMSCFLFCSMANGIGQSMGTKQLAQIIAEVRKGKTAKVRTAAAMQLEKRISQLNPDVIDDKTISELASLLNTPEDSVRLWVAVSLGDIGSRAKMAAPALLQLLPEVDCLRGSLTSAPAIRAALNRIGVQPPPVPTHEDCQKRSEPGF